VEKGPTEFRISYAADTGGAGLVDHVSDKSAMIKFWESLVDIPGIKPAAKGPTVIS